MTPRPVRTIALAIVLAATAAVAPVAHAQSAAERFDAIAVKGVADWKVPGLAVAVVKDGEVVFARGYGVRELGQEGAVDTDTLFAIGSTTKAMTAATLGMLVDEGKLSWSARVTDVLPGFELSSAWMTRQLTVRDLLTHNAGLGNADLLWYRSGLDSETVLHKVRLIPEAYSPRASFIYQNLMYAAAGAVVEKVSGIPWTEFVRQRIFAPLGMHRTVPLLAEAAQQDNVAAPHFRLGGEVRVIENASVDSVAAAGSVWSSVNDMARWAMFMLDGGKLGDRQLLKPETHAELMRPHVIVPQSQFYPTAQLTRPHWTTYGLGWFQHDYDGRAVTFHTGSIDGMVAIHGLIPDEHLGVYVLANRDHAELRHALMYTAFDLWGGKLDGRDWSTDLLQLYDGLDSRAREAEAKVEAARVAGTSPSHALDAYAGSYADPLLGEAVVELRDGALQLRAGEMSASLEHWHYDTFRARWDWEWMGTALLTFRTGADGKVTALEMGSGSLRRRDETERQ